jgi:hypothetical protein
LRRYWTNVCQSCAIKPTCTTGNERRITRWEHEHILEAVQRRLDERPEKMRQRRETVEHPFGTIKARMGATHFLMKTLPRVASEMALHVLAYNLTRDDGQGMDNGTMAFGMGFQKPAPFRRLPGARRSRLFHCPLLRQTNARGSSLSHPTNASVGRREGTQ